MDQRTAARRLKCDPTFNYSPTSGILPNPNEGIPFSGSNSRCVSSLPFGTLYSASLFTSNCLSNSLPNSRSIVTLPRLPRGHEAFFSRSSRTVHLSLRRRLIRFLRFNLRNRSSRLISRLSNGPSSRLFSCLSCSGSFNILWSSSLSNSCLLKSSPPSSLLNSRSAPSGRSNSRFQMPAWSPRGDAASSYYPLSSSSPCSLHSSSPCSLHSSSPSNLLSGSRLRL